MRAFVFLAVCAFYGIAVFPFSYFRNDDWLILGNGVNVLPQDWSFLFRPTLVFNSQEAPWFFRPGFKLGVYLFYRLFGLNYWAWLVATAALFWLAIWIGQRLTQRLNGPVAATFFFVLMASSVHLQFGSLVWIAEGLMNIPQLLLLVACASAFLHLHRWRGSAWLAWACFTLALAFKESSVIFLSWLAAAWWFHPQFQPMTWRDRIWPLVPMGVTAAIYLVVRLAVMPIFSGYLPFWEWKAFLLPTLGFLAALALPGLGLVVALRRRFQIPLWPTFFYGLFFLAWLTPHLGHPFFSPGWLLVPGFFFILTLAIHCDLSALELHHPQRAVVAVALVGILSLGPVLHQARKIDWWDWHYGQRELVDIFRAAPRDAYDRLTIFECSFRRKTEVPIWRVVGYEQGLNHAWRLLHPQPIEVTFLPCGAARAPASREMVLKYDFPHFLTLDGHKIGPRP